MKNEFGNHITYKNKAGQLVVWLTKNERKLATVDRIDYLKWKVKK